MKFNDLVAIFEVSGWQALGKIPNPLTGKTEVNLPAARNAVDILMLLRDKSRNNLVPEEEKLLASAIANLQLNYTETVKKKDVSAATQKASKIGETEVGARCTCPKEEDSDAGEGEKTGGEAAGEDK